jgi:UDP-N-acetylglucosamine 2-epimerase (non-hydrolysing)
MSDVFFKELSIPRPKIDLDIGSGTHGVQTGAMLSALDAALPDLRPDWVLIYGDTNSTLAAAVAAVKLHLRIAHLEAGLRSFNRQLPEEHNRVLSDHASDLLLAPSVVAAKHLANEGLADRTVVVGDVMVDVLFEVRDSVRGNGSPLTDELGLSAGSYSIATIHRAGNTDEPRRLAAIVDSLSRIDHPVLLLAHPRLVKRCAEYGIAMDGGSLIVHDPVSYSELVSSVMGAQSVVTDSGGLQKEAFLLRVPCTTVSSETPWVETVELGWNALAEPGESLLKAESRAKPLSTEATPYGTGDAAERVVEALLTASVGY